MNCWLGSDFPIGQEAALLTKISSVRLVSEEDLVREEVTQGACALSCAHPRVRLCRWGVG